MSPLHGVPVLLAVLVGLALGLVAWGFLRARTHEIEGTAGGNHDNVLLSMLVLAAFSLGAFVAYVVLAPGL